jgi:tetratricopeptide (TPR) repeat protein
MERVSIYPGSATVTTWLRVLVAALALPMSAAEVRGLTFTFDHEALLQQPQSPSQDPSLEQLQQRALQEGEAGKTKEAIQDYQKALLLEPAWKEGRWNLGNLEYSAGRFDDARATFGEVVQFAPNLGVAWALLGLSEFEVKDFTHAFTHLQRAHFLGIQDDVEIKRVSAYHLGLLLIRAGEFEQARSLLTTSFGTTMPGQVKAALGQATLRIPLLPDAIDPAQDALILAAGEAASAGQDGLAQFAKLVKVHPDVPYLNYAYALELAAAGQSSEAIVCLREEVHVSPQSPLPWIELSRLEAATPDKALQSASRAVAIAPDSREAHEALAKAEKAAGKAQQAIAEAEAAKASQPWPVREDRILERFALAKNGASGTAQTS